MEASMTDYRSIEMHIQRARLERSVRIGELIGSGIFWLWSGAKLLASSASAKLSELVQTPDDYSTGLPRFRNS